MTTVLVRGELVTLSGGDGRSSHVAGTFRVLRRTDLDALAAAFAALPPGRAAENDLLEPVAGSVGRSGTRAAEFHAWLVAEGHLAPVRTKGVHVRADPDAPGEAPAVTVRAVGSNRLRIPRPVRLR